MGCGNNLVIRRKGDGESSSITFVDSATVAFRETVDGDTRQIQAVVIEYVPPTVSLTCSPVAVEVGHTGTFNFQFTGNLRGNTLQTVTLRPTTGSPVLTPPYDGSLSFGFSAQGQRTTPGVIFGYSGSLQDDSGNPAVSATRQAYAYARWYWGFSYLDQLNADQIKGLGNTALSGNNGGAWGSVVVATVPTGVNLQYFYWARPVGQGTAVSSVQEGPLSVPIQNLGTVAVTNAHGVTQNYEVVRTSNAFAGGQGLNFRLG